MSKVNYGAHGYAAHFLLSLFDRYYPINSPESLSEADGIELTKKCIQELRTRFLMNQPNLYIYNINNIVQIN